MTTPLRTNGPRNPDFHICDSGYGSGLQSGDCLRALIRVPDTTTPSTFYAGPPDHANTLPVHLIWNDCHISIEQAGPVIPAQMILIPSQIRSLGTWLIEECIINEGGQGGFATFNFDNLLGNVLQNRLDPDQGPTYSPLTAFFTISVHGSDVPIPPSPGDKDPVVPLLISHYMQGRSQQSSATYNDDSMLYRISGQLWDLSAVSMRRLGNVNWWRSS